jgi:hypothetical protein
MNSPDILTRAKRLLGSIGTIGDNFLDELDEEAESIATGRVSRKRIVRYSALAAAASVGIAMTCWFLRPGRRKAA